MDNLKRVNDTLGHEAGDLALRLLADALRTGLRRDDAYRLGGDEFAIVLPGASELDAERVVERLQDAVSVAARAPVVADPGELRRGGLRAGGEPRPPGGPRRRGAVPVEAPPPARSSGIGSPRMCEHVFVSYVELHCHSAYSFLDGASHPAELAARRPSRATARSP